MALNTCANTGHICRLAITYCKIENSRLHLWQTATDNNVMHAKPDLRVVLKWKIYRPDSVIADVIPLNSDC